MYLLVFCTTNCVDLQPIFGQNRQTRMHTTVDARMNGGSSINDGDEQWADARMSIDATTAGTSTGE